jgi:hypothetical protein
LTSLENKNGWGEPSYSTCSICLASKETPTALPSSDHPCWQKLANGGLAKLTTQQLSLQLMSKRLERSTDSTTVKAAELHAFFVKWERTLGNEIQQIQKL